MPLTPFPYQETGRDWLVKARTGLLADQPGLGKTAQAILAAKEVFGYWRSQKICVICPKGARENWRREFARWWGPVSKPRDLFIIHYDTLIMGGPDALRFLQGIWDLIIIDEAHRLKTPGAKRTQTIYSKVHNRLKVDPQFRCWLLTGTPAKNHAGELYTHLAVLRPDLIRDRSGRVMSQEQFETKYCRVFNDAHGNRRIAGSKNIQELRKIMEDGGFFLRRRKSEVQTELPDLIFDDYPLDHKKAVPVFPEPYLSGKTFEDVLDLLRQNTPNLAEWRNEVAKLKVPLVKEFVENELDTPGEKMIVFFHHTALGRELYTRLLAYGPVIIDGKTKEAQDEVDTFNTDPNCRVLLGQISACQEALNMTAATQVAFAEAAWSPSDNYQAACRAHRIGMQDNLVVRFLSLANSPDEIIARVLSRKAAELMELFD